MRVPKVFIYCLAAVLVVSCNKTTTKETPLKKQVVEAEVINKDETPFEKVVRLAGDNKNELMKVIEHYEKVDNDSLKLKAAYFLIENMPGHKSVSTSWLNADGEEAKPNVMDYPDILSFRQGMDSLGYYQVLSPDREDFKSVKASFLISNIDNAFKSWKSGEWSSKINFEQFCEFLLPYRIGTEKLEDWRTLIAEKFESTIDSYLGSNGLYEDPGLLFQLLEETEYKYDYRANGLVEYQCFSEMMDYKIGTCEDQSALAVFTARALGMPAAIDYIPVWGNMNEGHAQVVFLNNQGKMTMYGDEKEEEYRRFAKVFRSTFSEQKGTIHSVLNNELEIPSLLRNKHYVDVTAERCEVSDVDLTFDQLPKDEKIVYLCVDVFGKWQAISWALVKDQNKALFKDMGLNVIYRAATYHKGRYSFVSEPFLLTAEGKKNYFNPQLEKLTDYTLEDSYHTEKVYGVAVIPGEEYGLYYWENGWKHLPNIDISVGGREFVNEKGEPDGVHFLEYKVPEGALCRLEDGQRLNQSRAFSMNDGKITWY